LSNTLSTESLAALECLALEPGESVEDRGDEQEDGRDNQARGHGPDADPLYSAQNEVDSSAHVIRLKLADEGIELRGRWADTQEKRDLDENDDERRDSASLVSWAQSAWAQWKTYKHTMLNAMTKFAWKMFAIPSAKQRKMHSTPDLSANQSLV
jgi:hypothetical protein